VPRPLQLALALATSRRRHERKSRALALVLAQRLALQLAVCRAAMELLTLTDASGRAAARPLGPCAAERPSPKPLPLERSVLGRSPASRVAEAGGHGLAALGWPAQVGPSPEFEVGHRWDRPLRKGSRPAAEAGAETAV